MTAKMDVVSVIGLGYVGLPLACGLVRRGFDVIGVDISPERIATLKASQSPIEGITDAELSELQKGGHISFTDDFAAIRKADIVVICVPTPLNDNREPDLTCVTDAARFIAPYLSNNQLVSLESTTYPGTTREVLIPTIEKNSSFRAGQDFFVCYAPEREDPGNKNFNVHNVPRVVGADDPVSRERAIAFYGKLTDKVHPVSSLDCAEAVKITENVYRAVNIALVNELKLVYRSMGIDIWEVIDAAKTKPFGYTPFYPGPGIGGHCIPVDPFYLTWRSKLFDSTTRFIELAGEINTKMPYDTIAEMAHLLNTEYSKNLNNLKVLVVGLSYKKNISDLRHSPTLKLIEILKKSKADLTIFDPIVPEAHKQSLAKDGNFGLLDELSAENIKGFDAVLIAMDHDGVDYRLIADNARIVFDAKNVMEKSDLKGRHILKV